MSNVSFPSPFDWFKPTFKAHKTWTLALCACVLALAACGGGGSGSSIGSGATGGSGSTLGSFTGADSFGNSDGGGGGFGGGDSGADGTSGEGKPFANAKITIFDSTGRVVTATTDAVGYYRAKVTGFVPPLVAKAELGAKVYYSFVTTTPPVNGFMTINITGFTDKIASDVALAAGKTSSAAITPAIVSANPTAVASAKAALRSVLATQLAANGLNASTFDPMTLPFRANGTGYDAVLDTTLVTKNGTGSTVITPNGQALVSGLDTSGIAALVAQFNSFGNTPSGSFSAGMMALFDANFVDNGRSKPQVFSGWQASPSTKEIRSASFSGCDLAAQTCRFNAQLYVGGVLDGAISNAGFLVRLVGATWFFYGDRAPVNAEFRAQAQRSTAYSVPPLPTFLNWRACISGQASDPNLANNNASGVTAVTGGNTSPLVIACTGTSANSTSSTADLYAILLAPASATANQAVIATVTFANNGPGTSLNATGTVVLPDGSAQSIVLGNMSAGTSQTVTVSYVVSAGAAPAPVTSHAFGYSGYAESSNGKYKGVRYDLYGMGSFTAAAPFTLMELTTKPACGTTSLVLNNGNSTYCDIFLSRTDSQLASLNNLLASGSATLRITLYEATNFSGTATSFVRGFNQTMFLSTDPAPAYSSIANPISFQTGSINYSAPVFNLYNVYIEVFKRNGLTPAFKTGATRWSDSSAVNLLGNASLAKAEALCGGCGAYSGANNPQITYLRTDGGDTAGRGVSTIFAYPYAY